MKMNSKLTMIACLIALLARAVVGQATNDDALSAKVDEIVRAQMREQNIPGVSLAVIRDGKIIKAAGYGLANVELNVPVAPQMVFNPGSLAKAFTATAVMMLVEEGKVGLDDKISKYLPEAPAAWNEITIRRLLTHTSGLRDYFGEDGDPKYDFHQDLTEDELVRKFAAQTMRFPAGEQWRYNNAGYVILGVVIHRVTGKFWFDFVKERILDPLGMTSTRLLSSDDIIFNRASGYQMVNGQRKNAPWLAPSWLTTADGSLYTNVFDMAKWDAALYTEKLIKRSTLEQMWTPVQLNNGTAYPYGFAWRISDVNGHRLIQHDGVDYSFTSRFARYVNDGLSVIVFMNLGEDDEAAMPKRMTDNVAAIYIPGLQANEGQTQSLAQPVDQANRTDREQLSPTQAEVWKGEQSLHLFEYQRNFKDYMPLWDAHFVGWPDYVQRPVGKPEIESGTVEEFKSEPTPHHPFIAPEPLAIAVFGDVAVTHYFWPEADQTSPTVFRITHTWQRGPDGWHIIGGMSCEVPRVPDGGQAAASADAEQQEVLKVSHAWLDAYNHRDLDAFARLMADDFIGATDDGIFMTKAALLKRMSSHPSQADQRINVRDVRMRVDGETAIVNYRFSLTEQGFENGRLIFELRRTEVFQKKNGAWLAIAAHDSLLPINHREPVKADPKTLKDYAGEYEHFRPGFKVIYTVEGDHLIDEWKGDKIEALPMGKDTFFEREDLGWTTFVRDRQGRVTGYVYHYADGQLALGRKIK